MLKNILEQLDRQLYASYARPERVKGQLLEGSELTAPGQLQYAHENRKSYSSRIEYVRGKYLSVKDLIKGRYIDHLHY